jgi:hypothetical protein
MDEQVRVVEAALSVECQQTNVSKPVSVAVFDRDGGNQIAIISVEEFRRAAKEFDKLELAYKSYLDRLKGSGFSFKTLAMEVSELKKLVVYNPFTGNFIRRKGINKGKIAGMISKRTGYVCVKIGARGYLGHRLAWFYMTGKWPTCEIDHINTVRHDNRWINLREATRGQNQSNGNAYKNNLIGLKGVGTTNTGRFRARIRKDGKEYQIGTYDTPEEAHAAYVESAIKKHGEFARA